MTQEKQLQGMYSNDTGYQPPQITTADPAAVAAAEAAKQRIQAAYIMARHNPRNVEQSRQNILGACRRPRFAEKAEYSKPVAGGRINGPSVRFAELALREYGNIMSDIQVVYEDEQLRRIKVYLTDLQTNAQFSKEITVQKTVERRSDKGREVVQKRKNTYGDTVYVVKATDDEMANKEAALISKALRNEGLRLIPGDIIEEALDVARETREKGAKEDPDAQKRKILDAFKDIGIKVVDLEKYLKHSIDQASPSEIDDLRSVYQTIKDGEAKWSDYVEETEKPKAEDILKTKKATEKPKAKTDPKNPYQKPEEKSDEELNLEGSGK